MSTAAPAFASVWRHFVALLQVVAALAIIAGTAALPYWCATRLLDPVSYPTYRWAYQIGFVIGCLSLTYLAFIAVYGVASVIAGRRRGAH